MRVGATYGYYFGVRPGVEIASGFKRVQAANRVSGAASDLGSLDDVFAKALRSLEERGSGRLRPYQLNGQAIELAGATTTTMTSSEEINTITSTYTDSTPEWSGSSDSDPMISGTYTGPEHDTLTFTVTQERALLGLVQDRLSVTDSTGQTVASLTVPFGSSGAGSFDLGNGLTVTFDGGTFELGDSFALDVYADPPVALNPDNPFNGEGVDRPYFDVGEGVVDGTFELNGETIAVFASDTLHDVLERINLSDAGVRAVFNTETDRVELEATVAGSGGEIEFTGDTSGLISALKLHTASPDGGEDHEFLQTIGSIDALAGVTSGTISINGVDVAVETDVDTISDVVNRLHDLTDAEATFTLSERQLRLAPDAVLGRLDISDTSGLLEALGVRTGSFAPRSSPGGLTDRASGIVASAVQEIGRRFADVLAEEAGYRSASLAGLRTGYRTIVEDFSTKGYLTILDRLALAPAGDSIMPAGDAEASSLRQALLVDPSGTASLLLRGTVGSSDDGLLERLRSLVAATAIELETEASRLRYAA